MLTFYRFPGIKMHILKSETKFLNKSIIKIVFCAPDVINSEYEKNLVSFFIGFTTFYILH